MKIFYGNLDESVKGSNPPVIQGFTINPDGSAELRISGGANVYEAQSSDEDVTWKDLIKATKSKFFSADKLKEINEKQVDDYDGVLENIELLKLLGKKLRKYCHKTSDAERSFFDLYMEMCLCYELRSTLKLPALFPKVWVNWDVGGKATKRGEPCYFDFAFKHHDLGTKALVLVEIDGPSHYAYYDEDSKKYSLSEKAYADHLKKDRWARKRGYNLHRIGRDELKQIDKIRSKEEKFYAFKEFFKDVFSLRNFPPSLDRYQAFEQEI